MFLDIIVSQGTMPGRDRLTGLSIGCGSDLLLPFCRAGGIVGISVKLYRSCGNKKPLMTLSLPRFSPRAWVFIPIVHVAVAIKCFWDPLPAARESMDMLCASCLNRAQRDEFGLPHIPLSAIHGPSGWPYKRDLGIP